MDPRMNGPLPEKHPATQACPKKFTMSTLPRHGETQQRRRARLASARVYVRDSF